MVGGRLNIYIVGLNLKNVDYHNTEELERYIDNILKIKKDYHKAIYIEELDLNYVDIRKSIEKRTSLRFPRGKGIWYYNIPIIAKDIFKNVGKDISRQEVLLIVDKKESALELISIVKDTFKFISLTGISKEEGKSLYEKFLEEDGISIFQPLNLEEGFRNYNVIINDSEREFYGIEEISQGTIVFDLSTSKLVKSLKGRPIIRDIKLNIKNKYNMENNLWIDNIISADLYKGIFGGNLERYYQITVGGKMKDYFVREYVKEKLKIKGSY